MQVVLSAISSRLYRMLGDFHMSTDTLSAKLFTSLISMLVPLALNVRMKSNLQRVVKGAKRSLLLQLGI